MKDQYTVLFLCTANSARSIMAEAIANQLGKGRLRAFSAGSTPSGQVHPMAMEMLQEIGLPTNGLSSKSWDAFAGADTPPMDFIITLCDRAADEPCPVWPGRPITAHWSVPDPALAADSPEQARKAFNRAMQIVQHRISLLLALNLDALDRLAIAMQLSQIARSPLDQSQQ
ncbi:MAG TPA: arsenate reductase ArsC [Xanthomonadales bacterium]|nr:arsenate reductase ArsC [Xanthomonadales bacterium]